MQVDNRNRQRTERWPSASDSRFATGLFHRMSLHAFLLFTLTLYSSAIGALQPVFEDEFDSDQLTQGWQFVQEVPERYSLTDRPGFFHITTARGTLGEAASAENLLIREFSGDFVLDTRIEFDPRNGRQFAGLLVYLDNLSAVALVFAFAETADTEFRGIVLLSIENGIEDLQPPISPIRESSSGDAKQIYLRLLRKGDQFVGAFSSDGQVFTDLGTVTNTLPDSVFVGVGGANGDPEGCGMECDIENEADFDFFRISVLDNDGGTDTNVGNALEEVTLLGPAELAAGSTDTFTAVARFADETESDVTTAADWSVAPSTFATIDQGVLTVSDVDADSSLTVVASYTQLTSDGEIFLLGTKTVIVRRAPTIQGVPCGIGMVASLCMSVSGLFFMRFLRNGNPYTKR